MMRLKCSLLLLVVVFMLPQLIWAEEDKSKKEDVKLEEVVVTATKTEKEVSEAPASVSVVTSKEIERKNIYQANDALRDIPGTYVRGGGVWAPAPGRG